MEFSSPMSRPRPDEGPVARPVRRLVSADELPEVVRLAAVLRGFGYSDAYIGRMLRVGSAQVTRLLFAFRRPFESIRVVVGPAPLSSRATNALSTCGIHSWEVARSLGEENVMEALGRLPNCGARTRLEIAHWMSEDLPGANSAAEARSIGPGAGEEFPEDARLLSDLDASAVP